MLPKLGRVALNCGSKMQCIFLNEVSLHLSITGVNRNSNANEIEVAENREARSDERSLNRMCLWSQRFSNMTLYFIRFAGPHVKTMAAVKFFVQLHLISGILVLRGAHLERAQ